MQVLFTNKTKDTFWAIHLYNFSTEIKKHNEAEYQLYNFIIEHKK